MKFYKFFFSTGNLALLFFAFLLISSCERSGDKQEQTGTLSSELSGNSSSHSDPDTPSFSSNKLEVKTFELKDSAGESKGWGYDIYIEGKKTIHQPIIPAIPGNRSFKTKNDAQKTGLFAVDKMIKEGTLPTLLVRELDSLGVLK